jgi:glucuronosyltransferase
MNMAKAVARGNGLQIPYEEISEKLVSETLSEMLDNPKYFEKAQTISNRFNDRPMTPQQSVVYWTEYAVKHKGAEHLRAAGTDLNLLEFHLIDIYFIIIVALAVVLFAAYTCLKCFLKLIFNTKSSGVDKQEKKKK